ncbi:hypothetical protein D3C81_2246710 [compost metagenome]
MPKGKVWSWICIKACTREVSTPTITATIKGGAESRTTSSMPSLNNVSASIARPQR